MAFIIHAEDIQHSAGNRRWHLRKKPLKMRDRPEHNRCKSIATRFFSQVEPPPRFIRKLKEPPLNRTNIFLGNRILTGCLSEAEKHVILFFDVGTGMPSRKSHLLLCAVSSLESVTGSFGSKVEVWLAPR